MLAAIERLTAKGQIDPSRKFQPLHELARTDNSLTSYDKHWNGLYHFLFKIGDYESMIIILDSPPIGAPPINPFSLVAYMGTFFRLLIHTRLQEVYQKPNY